MKEEIIQRTLDAVNLWSEAGDRVTALEAELAKAKEAHTAANQVILDIEAAAKVFGIDLRATMDEFFAAADAANVARGSAAIPIPGPSARPVREAVLELAKAAYPEPVRASELRVTLEKQRGGTLHEKTIGMTLYRLSKEGLMRREGQKNWFFVPEDQRAKNPGGETPGPVNRADEEEGNA